MRLHDHPIERLAVEGGNTLDICNGREKRIEMGRWQSKLWRKQQKRNQLVLGSVK